MKCPKCEFENERNSKYCAECGASLFKVCEKCGATISLFSKFCTQCGTLLSSPFQSNESCEETIVECLNGSFIICKINNEFIRILDFHNKQPIFDYFFDADQYWWIDDIMAVKRNGKWGIINPIRRVIVCDFIYDKCGLEDNVSLYPIFILEYKGLCGKIDANTGEQLLPFIYDDISTFNRIKYHGYWGVIIDGVQTVPFEFIKLTTGLDCEWDYLLPTDNSSWHYFEPSLHKNGKWGIIDIYTGEIILDFEYDEIRGRYNGFYTMRKGSLWGCLSIGKLGQFEYPCKYTLEEMEKKKNVTKDW